MDNHTRQQRSHNMACIRSKNNTSTEIRMIELLRSWSVTGWRRGFPLSGKPDFAFPKARLALFIDGCFWHGCPRCALTPATNRHYWNPKIRRNIKRDRVVRQILLSNGWHVLRVWEHSLLHPIYVRRRLIRALLDVRQDEGKLTKLAQRSSLTKSGGRQIHSTIRNLQFFRPLVGGAGGRRSRPRCIARTNKHIVPTGL